MSASLVGSEMCIRDRLRPQPRPARRWHPTRSLAVRLFSAVTVVNMRNCCLLYTSDAADDM
eukprot:15387025-Alexandrium_andersonii.AAC.1